MKSRVTGDCHARFRENAGVRFPCVTRLPASVQNRHRQTNIKIKMKDIIDKISSYNIFNYLFPGVLFVIIAKHLTDYNFVQEDNLLGAFLYYFIGMVISRFGSVIIEPILKKMKFLKFREYNRYVNASKKDPKLELLSEVNNTYRTLNSMMISLLFLKIYNSIETKFEFDSSVSLIILTILVFILFIFSYRKQTNYITKRIDANEQTTT